MAKKKKKKKSISILQEVDKTLTHTYDNLMEEIQCMQLMLNKADQKARKQAKKLAKKKNIGPVNYDVIRKKAREEVVGQMESSNFLERIFTVLQDIAPIITIIARLVASLILAILSIDAVKMNIKPKTLESMDKVYKKAMTFA